MKKQEEELQKQIENGLNNEAHEDALAYRKVFDALKREPDFYLSISFADKVISRLTKKEEKRDYWWITGGIFLTVIALIVSIVLTGTNWSAGVFTFLSSYKGLILFGVIFILLLQWVDRKMIRKNMKIH